MVDLAAGEESVTREVIARLRPKTELPVLLHMLSGKPREDYQEWHQRGVDVMTLTWSPSLSPQTLVEMRMAGLLCGISISPDNAGTTKLSALWPLLDIVIVVDEGDGIESKTTVKGLSAMRGTMDRPLLAVKDARGQMDEIEADLWIHP